MTNCKYCHTPIEQHDAGRCLDAMVANIQGFDIQQEGEYFAYVTSVDGEFYPKPYSTDLNHAIKFARLVCEKLNELRETHSISYVSHRLDTYTDHQVSTFKFDWRVVGDTVKSEKNSAPHAICIAGLKTLHLIEKMKGER